MLGYDVETFYKLITQGIFQMEIYNDSNVTQWATERFNNSVEDKMGSTN